MTQTEPPAARRPPRWTWIAALASLVVLAAVGVVAYLVPADTRGSAETGAESSATALPSDEAEQRAPEPAVPAEAGPTTTALSPEEANRLRFDPPAVGSCIRLDGWRPNLAEFVDCEASTGHYAVLWAGPRDEEPPVRCHFGYNYQIAEGDTQQVCLYPTLAPGTCYSIPVDGSHVTGSSSSDTVADSLNATVTPLDCEAPARGQGEIVVRVLDVVDGHGVAVCPAGMRYYLEDQVSERVTCLAPA